MNRIFIILLFLFSMCFVDDSKCLDPSSQNEVTEVLHYVKTRAHLGNKKIVGQVKATTYLQHHLVRDAGFTNPKVIDVPRLLYRKLICVYLL